MTLEQIDQLLADWKSKVNLISQNLIDLHGCRTYQRLAGLDGYAKIPLKGITQSRVIPALEAMNELFQHFELLLNTFNQAIELRKQVPRFLASEQKIQEIAHIFTKPSIQLSSVQTPLAQRGLLTAGETANAIAPEKLLEVMSNAFQVAKDAVLTVEEAWLRLEPTLAAAEAEIISLEKLANSTGQGALSELVTARNAIANLRNNLDSDPLGVSSDFDHEIKPLLTQARTTLEQVVKQKTQLQDKITSAHALLNKLTKIQAQNSTAYQESQEKVIDISTLKTPLTTEQIIALSQWLARLETKFSEGLLNPVSIGLENWQAKVKEYITTEEQAYITNQTPLKTRKELRGRLDALQAKAVARGRVEDAILVELAQAAKQLLYTRPTDLEKASHLISQYEKRLNS